jgi:hypothetical protein
MNESFFEKCVAFSFSLVLIAFAFLIACGGVRLLYEQFPTAAEQEAAR